MNKLIFFCLVCLWIPLAGLQAQPIFNVGSVTGNNGETVEVDFTVSNFEKIVSLQFSINWDSLVLEYGDIINVSTDLTGLSAAANFLTPPTNKEGVITLSWFEPNGIPITLPNGSRLFTLSLAVKGNPCDNTLVDITGTPLDIEVAEEGDIPINITVNPGQFMVPGVDCPMSGNLTITGSTEMGSNGQNVCVKYSAVGFRSLASMQFAVEFNENVISYTTVQNFGLPGFSAANFNPANAPNGEIVLNWFDQTTVGVDVPDGTILFELCFDIVGSNGQMTNLNYIDPPGTNIEIADGSSNVLTVDLIPGKVTVAGGNVEGLALFFSEECGSVNANICVDLTVQDFIDVITLEAVLNWNPAVLKFDRTENYGLPDFSSANIGPPGTPGNGPGQATIVWFDNNLTGVTLNNEDIIFSICFDLIGTNGQSSSVAFSSLEMADKDEVILNPTLIAGSVAIDSDCSPCGFSIDDVNNPCSGESNGSIDISVFGCSDPITYSWTGPNSFTSDAQDISGLLPGTYKVTITTGSGPGAQILVPGDIVLANVAEITSTAVITQPTGGLNNGSINLTVSGGTAPYTFEWTRSGTVVGNGEDLMEIGDGNYMVLITDDAGCTFVGGPYILGAGLAFETTDIACFGAATGSINLTVGFGTGPYTYSWVPASSNEDLTALVAGEYCVTVTDANGATMNGCATVLQPATAISVTETIVNDDNDNSMGSISLAVSGGEGPYSYLWDNSTGSTTSNISNLGSGSYCVTITDSRGCVYSDCFTVLGSDMTVSLTVMDYNGFGVSCSGECDGEVITTVGNGIGALTYVWSDGPSTDENRNDLCAGPVTVTVTDANGQTAMATLELLAPDLLTISEVVSIPSSPGATDGSISITVNGGTGSYTYLWNNTPINSTTPNIQNLATGEYMVIVTDENNCQAMKVISLRSGAECFEGISVITPNGDDLNENLIISCATTQSNKLSIFNRWGSLVYQVDNYDNTWNGVDQDNEPLVDGGYHWVLEVFIGNGDSRIFKGTVSLVRSLN